VGSSEVKSLTISAFNDILNIFTWEKYWLSCRTLYICVMLKNSGIVNIYSFLITKKTFTEFEKDMYINISVHECSRYNLMIIGNYYGVASLM
jgi:hypothetical protein